MIAVEVNPNKHHGKDSFQEIINFISDTCTSGDLVRYDYAIDIPLPPDKVQIFKSRKRYGLFKGTRYYGIRNNHGYCKIYDKAKEQELDIPLTRVEHVLVSKNKLSLEEFCYMVSDEKSDMSELTPTNKTLVLLALQIKALNGDYSDTLKVLDRRTRYKIEPYLTGGYKQYEYDLSILDNLLKKIQELFQIEESEKVYMDSEGFLQYDGEIPFE